MSVHPHALRARVKPIVFVGKSGSGGGGVGVVGENGGGGCQRGHIDLKTSNIGLQHPSSNRCHKWLRHRSPKTVDETTVFPWCSNGSKFVTKRTIQMILGRVSRIIPHNAASTNKANIVRIEAESTLRGADSPAKVHVYAATLCCSHNHN